VQTNLKFAPAKSIENPRTNDETNNKLLPT